MGRWERMIYMIGAAKALGGGAAYVSNFHSCFFGFRNPKIFRLFPKGVRECRDGASVSVCFCMTLIQSIYGIFRHALRLQLKHISHPAVAFVSKVSVGRRRRRDRWRHHELNRARRRACVALARHRRGPLAEDIEGSIVGAAEGRALQPRQERAQGFSSRPESYRAAGCVPG